MTKRIIASVVFLGSLTAGSAVFADEAKKAPTKEEGQAKVDAAKTEVCEKGKAFLSDQKAKGKCASESDEAAKITCSAATSKQVTDLMTKCTSAAAKPGDSKAAPPVDAAVPKCRAVDNADASKVLAEAEDKLTTKCERLLQDKIKTGACAEAANKGRKLELVTQFDHMIGKARMKDGKISMTCPK
ncbi:MAG: hypothetical protein ABI175_05775 [Polyangiales bacterium]